MNLHEPTRFGLTVEEVAEGLRCSTNHVRKLILTGELPARKVGRSWLVHPDSIHAWLKAGSPNPQDEPDE